MRATFVGASACRDCHQAEFKRWNGSHHQLAMQPATDATVLADFNNTKFTNSGVTSFFFKSAAKFMVRTDGPDGALHDYEIKFTLGVFPLAAVSYHNAWRPLAGTGYRLGQSPADVGGPTLVLSLPKPEVVTFGPAALVGD